MKRQSLPKIACIYSITNVINNKKYVGSTRNLKRRFCEHQSALLHNRHKNRHLQNSWNKYGEENFIFTIICDCDLEDSYIYEQVVIDKLKPEYNIRKIAINNKGVKFSETHNKNLSNSRLGQKYIGIKLKSPHGKKVIIDTYLTKFCKKNSLCASHTRKVILGIRFKHKGWTLWE